VTNTSEERSDNRLFIGLNPGIPVLLGLYYLGDLAKDINKLENIQRRSATGLTT